jgi:hypothetical protein
MGNTALRETAKVLLETAKMQSDATVELHLIPEMTAESLQVHGEFQITEDPDHHDYLISTERLTTLSGGPQAHTRELVNRFRREHQTARFEQCSLEDPSIRASLDTVFYIRENHKGSVNQKELAAFKRSLQPLVSDNQQLFGVFIEDNLQAFISCEQIDDTVSIAHFSKANTDYRGIYQYLIHSLSQTLHMQQVQTLNMEQDLGLPGLRASKQYLRPIGYLKKYVIQQKPTT